MNVLCGETPLSRAASAPVTATRAHKPHEDCFSLVLLEESTRTGIPDGEAILLPFPLHYSFNLFFLCFVLKRHKKKKNGATRRAKRSRNACQRWLPPLSVGFLAKQKIMLVIAVDQTLTNPQGLPLHFSPISLFFFF